jgi:thiol-disulfide isomerase/thioredoxin
MEVTALARSGWRQRWLAGGLLAGLLAATAASAGSSPAKLTLKDLEGRKVRLEDYRSKLVVVNFWATWCGPCQAEMPLLVEAQQTYGPRGVVVVGVAVDEKDTRSQVPEFLAKHPVNFPIWLGSPGDLDKLDLGIAIPATAFLDRDGRVVARIVGQMREHELQERLDWLTGDRTEPPPAPRVSHLDGN